MSTLVSELQQAVQLHQAGEIPAAEQIYHRILRRDPTHSDALHLLGVAAHQTARNADAVEYIRRAIAIHGTSAMYHCNLGAAYRELSRFEDAIASFRTAIEIDPKLAGAHYNLAMALEATGRFDEAAAEYRKVVRIEPGFAAAHCKLGNALAAQDRHAEAVSAYESALQLAPGIAEIHNNLGTALLATGRQQDAVSSFREAVRLNADYAEAHNNLGSVLHQMGDIDGAERSFRQAIELRPDFTGALTNLGNIANDRGELDAAIACYSWAIARDSSSAEAHFNRALASLRAGDFANGWPEYQWRFQRKVAPRDFVEPIWSGEDLTGKTILAYAEQGVGDEIQFASCLPDLIVRAGRCVVECDSRLVPLFARSFPKATIVGRPILRAGRGDVQPAVDYQTSFGSLPQYCRRSIDEFPIRRAFLAAEPARVRQLRRGLPVSDAKMNVGISWLGGSDPDSRRKRSVPLRDWRPILSRNESRFVSLQYGDCSSEIAAIRQSSNVEIVESTGADLWKDLDELAAQIAALDLVITVDNSTAHLAGALGVPVWTLLPVMSDWRWMMHRESSPWYPSMRLFRQTTRFDWTAVVDRVAGELAALISGQS